jgi:hypothetical protein
VLDTEKYTVRLKAEPEVKAKLIRREGGKMEKQYRYTPPGPHALNLEPVLDSYPRAWSAKL